MKNIYNGPFTVYLTGEWLFVGISIRLGGCERVLFIGSASRKYTEADVGVLGIGHGGAKVRKNTWNFASLLLL